MREPIVLSEIEESLSQVRLFLDKKIKEKGNLSFSSIHEILGVLTEEYEEFKKEVHANNHDNIEYELKDIIVSALWGLICLRNRKLDW